VGNFVWAAAPRLYGGSELFRRRKGKVFRMGETNTERGAGMWFSPGTRKYRPVVAGVLGGGGKARSRKMKENKTKKEKKKKEKKKKKKKKKKRVE